MCEKRIERREKLCLRQGGKANVMESEVGRTQRL